MYKFITILFLILFQTGLLNAEVINDIRISGNKRVSNETIKIYGGIKINEN